MIKDLFLFNIKQNRVYIISFTLIIMMYGTISIGMFNPDTLDNFDELLEMIPETMVKMMGFDNMGGTMTQYVSNYMYGFIMLLFPVIYLIITGNKVVSKHVDSGSMTYLVTMPYSRKQIITTQAVFFGLSIVFILLVNVGIMLAMSELMYPGMLEYTEFITLNFVTVGVQLLLASITFLFSCIFSDSGKTLGISGGLLILFFVVNMISQINESVEFLQYFTPFSIIDVQYILEGGGNGVISGILVFIGAIMIFVCSIFVFDKKSLII